MEKNMTQWYEELATNEDMTIERAVAFLEREAHPRSFSEIIEKFCPADDPKKILTAGLKENHQDLAAGSVEKRVRGWFQGKHGVEKSDAVELCYILELDLEQADDFVALLAEERFHWRDPEELIDIFALAHHYSYAQAKALKQQLLPCLPQEQATPTPKEEMFTALVKRDVLRLRNEEELKSFLFENSARLGKLHNNAYRLFIDRLNLLESPPPDYIDDSKTGMTIRDILLEYMYIGNISQAKERARRTKKGELRDDDAFILSAAQKNVLKYWPDETTLSKIKSRAMDVTRKVLILLLLATEEGFQSDLNEDDWLYEEPEEYSREEAFADIYGRLNQTLLDCGFSTLDARVPFDWMVLYSICVEDIFDADLRMRGLIRRMFPEDGN